MSTNERIDPYTMMGFLDIEGEPRYRRFDVKMPIMDLRGREIGEIYFSVTATSLKQARAHARKEMLKLARISTNRAAIIDVDPPKRKDGRDRL